MSIVCSNLAFISSFLQGSFTSTGLVVSSKLPRFSDMYTLTIESADPKSVSANEPVHLTKSVTQWYLSFSLHPLYNHSHRHQTYESVFMRALIFW